MKTLVTLLIALSLAGCAAPRHDAPANTAILLDDTAFGPPTETITTAGLFDLSPEMRAYIRSPGFRKLVRDRGQAEGLVDALYATGELKLDYDASQTRTAAETFDTRSGNCLSLVIMTGALGKALGLEVVYQEVQVEQLWSREGTLYFASSHVNLALGKASAHTATRGFIPDNPLVVDFIPPADAARYRASAISEGTIEAMYINNRAAEALAGGRNNDAYWWARKAVSEHPAYAPGYNTLGAIYHRSGQLAKAEQVFNEILARDPHNQIALQNQVRVLEAAGKPAESQALAARLAALEPNPPYKFFNEGMSAMQRKDYRAARKLFAREVRRAPENHEFHFWLAMANLQLGDTREAGEQLALARDMSTTIAARDRYAGKLQHLMLASRKQTRR